MTNGLCTAARYRQMAADARRLAGAVEDAMVKRELSQQAMNFLALAEQMAKVEGARWPLR